MTISEEYNAMNALKAVNTLIKLGVKSWDIYDHCGGVRAAAVSTEAGFFTPDKLGRDMIIQPIHEFHIESLDYDQPEPDDLIAWHPSRPEKWFFRVGDPTPILGKGLLAHYRLSQHDYIGLTLNVYHTPLEWLRNAGNGVCCLNRRSIREMLGLRHITVHNEAYAEIVAKELNATNPIIPQIALHSKRNGAAAGGGDLKPPPLAPAAATYGG